ncbi:MAG: hypothetical protein KGY65_04135 [Candidatus Thermoplasmatota archaeon]|nr:hypothetical protein [Candidatus Thermoplasmatota archaeon]
MTRKKTIVIKLIKKKTGEKIRTIRFRKPSEFDYFLNSFKKMRYPGYDWEYLKK